MRHRSKHTLFDVGKHQKSKARTSSTFTLGKNSHLAKKNNKLHSKSTYFYNDGSRINYVVPSICALALLIGGIVAINPQPNRAYAEEGNGNNGVSNVDGDAEVMPLADSSISLSFNGTPTLTEEVTAGEVAYITNTFTVNANKQTGFTLQLSAMNGSSTELRGKDNAMATIKGVGENVSPANFANNTWGYSYQENPNTTLNPKTIAESLTYSSMPAYGTEKSIANKTLTGVDNENTTYLLAFAAKIGIDSPADHYIGNFLLSVVGNAFNPKTYTLTYDANNGTNPPATTSCTQASVGANCDITISSSTPSREGFSFLGWADNPTDESAKYSAGSTISMDANKTIYAIWKADTPVVYSVTYASLNDGNILGPLPQKQEATSTADTYTFKAAGYGGLSYCYTTSNPPIGWSTTRIIPSPTSSTSIDYAAGDTITLTRNHPTITLYPVFKPGSYGICAGEV